MDSDPTRVERFAAWSDLVSLVLVATTIYLGGLTPVRYAWGRPLLKKCLLIIFMTLTIVFSATRFIIEGIFVAAGPREFLVISVIYVARWLWFFISLNESGTAARGLLVARGLMELHVVRYGISPSPSRRGHHELVIRRGSSRHEKGIRYWRGVEKNVQYNRRKELYLVDLVETRLHSRSLNKLGVAAYKHENDPLEADDIFRVVYQVIMTAESQNPDQVLVINYGPFYDAFSPVPSMISVATRTGCTDESVLADVARRVAADAAYFISSSDSALESRTLRQMEIINRCIQQSVEDFLEGEIGEDVTVAASV